MSEFVARMGEPSAIAMEVAIGFARLVELVARTHVLDPGKDGLDHSLINLFNHAQALDHEDAVAAVSAARSALRHTIEFPSTPRLGDG